MAEPINFDQMRADIRQIAAERDTLLVQRKELLEAVERVKRDGLPAGEPGSSRSDLYATAARISEASK